MNTSLIVPNRSGEGSYVKKRALVVDDVDDMLDLLEIALSNLGFSVLRAASTADALQLFEANGGDVDLLMTDVRVGNDSGLELARKLITAKPTLHVLAISGFAIDGKLVLAKTRIEFLHKPFSTSELKSKLSSIFSSTSSPVTVTVSAAPSSGFTVATVGPFAEVPESESENV